MPSDLIKTKMKEMVDRECKSSIVRQMTAGWSIIGILSYVGIGRKKFDEWYNEDPEFRTALLKTWRG